MVSVDGLDLIAGIVLGAFLIWLSLVAVCMAWGRWIEHQVGR